MGNTISGWARSHILILTTLGMLVAGSSWPLARYFGAVGDGTHSVQRWSKDPLPKVDPTFTHLLDPVVTKTGVEATADPINWALPHVAVYSVPAAKTSRSLPTVRDLTDSGQAHAIDLLGKDPAKRAAVWAAIQSSMMDPKEFSTADKDPLQFERVLVATVTKGTDWLPGDRMQWTRVFVEPINFAFAGYTVASTDSDTIKVQSVENTNTRKLSADIALTIPGLEGPKADIAPSNERVVKTTSDVKAQYERLGVDIMPAFLRIMRESEVGGDSVGNTLVSLSVTTDPSMILNSDPQERRSDNLSGESIGKAISRLIDRLGSTDSSKDDVVLVVTGSALEDGALGLSGDKASLSVAPQRPVPHCPLLARVWMLYEERRIDKGRAFYDESKQEVSLLRNADPPRDVEVVSADDVSPAIWSIQILSAGAPTNGKIHLLGARADESSPYRELAFTDFRQASTVARWERTNPGITISHLSFNYANEGGSLVPIRKTGDDCKHLSSVPREVYQPEKSATASQRNSTLSYVAARPSVASVARSRLRTAHQRGHGGGRYATVVGRLRAASPRNHAVQLAIDR